MATQPQKQSRQSKPRNDPKVLAPFDESVIYSEEIERACMGAVLTNPNHYYKVARIIDDGRAFYFNRYEMIWAAIRHLVDNELAVDVQTISYRLRDLGQLEDIGGPAILTQMISETPTSTHAETYARLIQRLYSKRQMLSLAREIKVAVNYDPDQYSLEQILSKIINKVDATMDNISKRVVMTMSDHGHDHLTVAEEARAKGDVLRPILSGIPGMDDLIEGFFPATYLVGARVHEGKTITLSTIALNAALADKSVMFINCADGDLNTVLATFYGMESGLPPAMIERRTYNDKQYSKYVECLARMDKLRLFIEHQNGVTPRDIWTKASIIQRVHGLDMIVIDYIQEMGVDQDVKVRNEREKLIYISSALKDIRKKFNVPVIYGAQIRLDGDHDKQPRVENAQESRNIIQNADVGIALWHKRKNFNELILSVQKNKKGNHRKGKNTIGFSGVTGRVAAKGVVAL